MASKPTEIMIAVSQSSMLGYPHPSLSSSRAFHWTAEKLVRSIPAGFRLLFVHVDKDAMDDKDLKDKTRGLSLLEYFETQCRTLKIPCKACIRRGNPGQVICSEVQRLHPDLLVVGNRGLNLVQSTPFHPVHPQSSEPWRLPPPFAGDLLQSVASVLRHHHSTSGKQESDSHYLVFDNDSFHFLLDSDIESDVHSSTASTSSPSDNDSVRCLLSKLRR